jgi:hypothetical protein
VPATRWGSNASLRRAISRSSNAAHLGGTGPDRTGLDWTGLDWTGLDWTGLDWTGLDWTGLDWTSFPIARLRYVKGTQAWTLYWRDRNLRFHVYDRLPPSPHVDDLLVEIDRDPTAIFWG